jgi:ubiquinone/menaquinone biosynthesis C-methylase UbiE
MKKIIESSVLFSNLFKTALYSIEYKMLHFLSKSLSPFVTPPSDETDKELLNHLKNEVIAIHRKDAEYISSGVYPLNVIVPKSPLEHLINLPYLFYDSLRISRRRKLNLKKDFSRPVTDVPDYLNRNFHFQTDGYFSDQSAKIYEHQVEVLFSGTAGPMRRMLIKYIKDRLPKERPLRILEIGAGVGSASLDFAKAFDGASFTITDISSPYLALAKKRLLKNGHNHFDFVETSGESLPFEDQQFDIVYSVYLFHELPQAVREKVIAEAQRVLAPGGILAICDSLQIGDVPLLNQVLEKFPLEYHEPFYRSYTLWNVSESLSKLGFQDIQSGHQLLSKYWTALKQ